MITINANALKPAVNIVSKFVPRRHSTDAFTHILFKAKDGTLEITGTDGDGTFVTVSVPVPPQSQLTALIDRAALSSILKAAKSRSVLDLTAGPNGRGLAIRFADTGATVSAPGLDPAEFPSPPRYAVVDFPVKYDINAVRAACAHATDCHSFPAFSAVIVGKQEDVDIPVIAGADGHRIFIHFLPPCSTHLPAVLVPRWPLSKFLKAASEIYVGLGHAKPEEEGGSERRYVIIDGAPQNKTLRKHGAQISVAAPEPYAKQYPISNALAFSAPAPTFSVELDEIIPAAKTFAPFFDNEYTPAVALIVDGDVVHLVRIHPERGPHHVAIPTAEYYGPNHYVILNYYHLLDGLEWLAAVGAERAVFRIWGKYSDQGANIGAVEIADPTRATRIIAAPYLADIGPLAKVAGKDNLKPPTTTENREQ